jgi:hypothetical protein
MDRIFVMYRFISAMLLFTGIAGCATSNEPLETYLVPPPPLRGTLAASQVAVSKAYMHGRTFVKGLYLRRSWHLQQREAGLAPERNLQCAHLLEREIRQFSWPANAIELDEEKNRINQEIANTRCNESRHREVTAVGISPSVPLPTPAQVRAFASIDEFLDGYVASKYSAEEKARINWQAMRGNGIYFYRAYIPGVDMANVLAWPRNALRMYCTEHNGRLVEEAYPHGARLASRMETAALSAGMSQAVEKDAFGKKSCVANKVLLWSLYLSPNGMSGILPSNLEEPHVPLAQRTYIMELTLGINAGIFRAQWGSRYE